MYLWRHDKVGERGERGKREREREGRRGGGGGYEGELFDSYELGGWKKG